MRGRLSALALLLLLAIPLTIGVAMQRNSASSQTLVPEQITRRTIPPLPPTVPCEFCGPSGQIGDGTTAWTYPLHFCLDVNAPDATFAIVYGLGRLVPGPVTFFGSIQGTVRQLDTLNPGDATAEFFVPPNPLALTVSPGELFLLHVWATTDGTQTGPRMVFGNGTTERILTLVCTCPGVPTTVATTVPTTPTTVPRVATSVARTSSSAPVTLPATP